MKNYKGLTLSNIEGIQYIHIKETSIYLKYDKNRWKVYEDEEFKFTYYSDGCIILRRIDPEVAKFVYGHIIAALKLSAEDIRYLTELINKWK